MKYVLLIIYLLSACSVARAADHTVQDGVFTEVQVHEGKTLFGTTCADGCHIDNLMGSGPTPSLRGDEFLLRWTDFSLAEFLEFVSTTMPKDESRRLTEGQYLSVTAYILSANGFPTGGTALGNAVPLNEIYITGGTP